ncbi:hypothetical protein ACQPZZ_28015 [Microbispora sp. CA-135349]|uniref:hypothetical protein n=1 Tax=Microbispora sp. CA-135349 TaxID=3239953 RepID=UPI003D8F21A7
MDSARHSREAGRLPRSLVLLASAALVAGTGAALWALPAAPPEGWHVAPGATPAGHRTPASATPETLVAARQTVAAPAPPAAPSADAPAAGYRGFLDAAGEPRPELTAAGVRSFAIGHVVAGPDGCTPHWAGVRPHGGDAVAARIGRLRADGGEVWPAFGGPYGRELSATCENPARLLAAYRRVVAVMDPPGVDIEPTEPAAGHTGETGQAEETGQAGETGQVEGTDPAGETAARRRAAVLARLQREAWTRAGSTGGAGALRVTFTLPASRDGLGPAGREALRITREAGVEIESVGLLVPMGSAPSALHDLAVAARAARPQIAVALGVSPDAVWRRMGLAPVLTGSRDLGPGEAARLAAFRARNGLAWLSVRGARPSEQVLRILTGAASPVAPATRSRLMPGGHPVP